MKLGYSTYVFGQNAIISPALPKFGIAEKKSMKKLTVKQQLKQSQELAKTLGDEVGKLRAQMHDQNNLLDRARIEGNQLIDKYNKLAGKVNAMRTLVNSND